MKTVHSQFTESHSSPSETPWTTEENARYAAGRAETVRLAQQRAKSRVNGTFTLIAGTIWTAVFQVEGDTVTLMHVRGRGKWARAEAPITMTRSEAREVWARLVDSGYTTW